MVYPNYDGIFPSEIEANGGGGSPPLSRYKKCNNSLLGTAKKSNDMDIQFGLLINKRG